MPNLDELYEYWWNSPQTNPAVDDLIAGVRQEALRMTRDEDIAQSVCVIVINKLETFVRADATAFSRWVRTIVRRTRLDAFHTASLHTREFDENAVDQEAGAAYVDTSDLPSDIRQIADKLVEGYKLVEIAAQLNVTSAALRNKLSRFRKSALRNAA